MVLERISYTFLHVLTKKTKIFAPFAYLLAAASAFYLTSGMLAAGVTVREEPIATHRSAVWAWSKLVLSISVKSRTLLSHQLITLLLTFRKTLAKVDDGIN